MPLKEVLDQLKAFNNTTTGEAATPVPDFNAAGFSSSDAVNAVFAGQADGDLKSFVQKLSDAKGRSLYNGFKVYYLPSSKEILQYLVRGAASAHMDSKLGVANADPLAAAESAAKGAAHIPQGELDRYLMSSTFLDVTNSTGPKNWDARVKAVQDKMVSGAKAAGDSAFDPANIRKAPGLLTQLPWDTTKPTPRVAVPSGPYGPRVVTALPLTYVVKGMRGGSSSAHAPLYPSVVMNGGASPFAIYGGDVKSVAQVKSKFESMEKQVNNQVPGVLTDADKMPSKLAEKLGQDIDKLIVAQTNLQNALLALSSGPYAPGVSADSYDALAKAGAEINEKAAKVSRGWDRLSKIEVALEELLMKTKNVALSGGLHNALKH